MLKMKLWLVGLGLALLCTVSADFKCSGDHSKMNGRWFVNMFATNCTYFLENKDLIKMLTAELTFEMNSEMHITTVLPEKDRCKKVEMKLEKLDDGTYYHKSDWGSTKLMEVMSTDCETYAISHTQIEHDGKTSDHLAIYSRAPELSLELKEKFLESVRSSKFTSDQIISPNKVACQDEEYDEKMPVP